MKFQVKVKVMKWWSFRWNFRSDEFPKMELLTSDELREKFSTAANYSVTTSITTLCHKSCSSKSSLRSTAANYIIKNDDADDDQVLLGLLGCSAGIGFHFWRQEQARSHKHSS